MSDTLIDTGPLVAALLENDRDYGWVTATLARLRTPLWTVEPVITEACFLLRRTRGADQRLLQLLVRGELGLEFSVGAEAGAIADLMAKYSNVPMSLADAALVRLSELRPGSSLVTLDRDFTIYRRHGRQKIPLIAPWA